jgi:hypothetical protein
VMIGSLSEENRKKLGPAISKYQNCDDLRKKVNESAKKMDSGVEVVAADGGTVGVQDQPAIEQGEREILKGTESPRVPLTPQDIRDIISTALFEQTPPLGGVKGWQKNVSMSERVDRVYDL